MQLVTSIALVKARLRSESVGIKRTVNKQSIGSTEDYQAKLYLSGF